MSTSHYYPNTLFLFEFLAIFLEWNWTLMLKVWLGLFVPTTISPTPPILPHHNNYFACNDSHRSSWLITPRLALLPRTKAPWRSSCCTYSYHEISVLMPDKPVSELVMLFKEPTVSATQFIPHNCPYMSISQSPFQMMRFVAENILIMKKPQHPAWFPP